jgi:hypothetical protein
MRGYPKRIATKQDIDNLLAIQAHAANAKSDMARIAAVNDDKAIQVLSGSEETKDLVTKQIDSPNPTWKRLGFASKLALTSAAAAAEVGGTGSTPSEMEVPK